LESLPCPVDECILAQGVRVAKQSGFGSTQVYFGGIDQGEAAFPLEEANVGAAGLLRLSGASQVSVVESPTCGIEMTWALFRLITARCSGVSLAKAKCVRDLS